MVKSVQFTASCVYVCIFERGQTSIILRAKYSCIAFKLILAKPSFKYCRYCPLLYPQLLSFQRTLNFASWTVSGDEKFVMIAHDSLPVGIIYLNFRSQFVSFSVFVIKTSKIFITLFVLYDIEDPLHFIKTIFSGVPSLQSGEVHSCQSATEVRIWRLIISDLH